MKRHISKLIALAFVIVGCGAPDDYDNPETESVGRVTQAWASKKQQTYQWGVTDLAARTQCFRQSGPLPPNQTCIIPTFGGTNYFCLAVSVPAADKTLARQVFADFNTAATAGGVPVSWIEGPDPFFPSCALTIGHTSLPGVVPGPNDTLIETYRSISFGLTLDVTEGANGEDPVGNYKRHMHDFSFNDALVAIDRTDINNKFGSGGGRNQLYRHAIGSALLAWHGLGSRTDQTASTTWQRRTLASAGSILSPMNAGAKCLLASGNYTQNGDYTITGNTCDN